MAEQSKAIEKKKQQHPAVMAKEWLNNKSDKLSEWCSELVTPETLIRVGTRLVMKEEKFQDPKTWPSLYMALITAAQLGLEPDGPKGEGYLIPYYDRNMGCNLVQFQPGYRGIMKLITASGEIKSIRSHVVHENDIFEMQLGSNKRVDHQPAWKGRGAPVAVYSIATYENGDEDYEIASWDDVKKAKASSKGKSPAWDNWPEQMARKFVIKRHSNQLPLDNVARKAVAIDNISSDTAAADAQNIIDADVLEDDSPRSLPAPKQDSTLKANLKTRSSKRKAPTIDRVAKKAHENKSEEPQEEDVEVTPLCDMCGMEDVASLGEVCGACQDAAG